MREPEARIEFANGKKYFDLKFLRAYGRILTFAVNGTIFLSLSRDQ